MKRKLMLIGISLTLLVGIITTSAVALADYYSGPYNYSTSYSTNWNGSPYYLNCIGTLYHYASYDLFYETAQGRYTKYRIQDESYGNISVSASATNGVMKEMVDLYTYTGARYSGTTYWDTIYPGYSWGNHTYPNGLPELTKPASGSDATSLCWSFDWNYLIWGSYRPLDYLEFYYYNNTFYSGKGLD